ncbi:MAG TPA: hypothetical protein VKR42_07040, partial [Ktedonobacteraceae bacterium]|nr:hypothetical protein [Ktedonobacteraceae bacterium]
DFGIACGYDDSQQSLTRVGWGSAEYVAPEQSLGVLRRSSDIYALGILLFHLLTGQPPFTGQTPVEVLLKHVRQQAPSARSLVPGISDAVDNVIQIALQKRSDDRFASAEELSNAYIAAVSVAPVASPVARSITRQLPPPLIEQSSALPVGNLSNPYTPVPPFHTGTLVEGLPRTPEPLYPAYRVPVAPSPSQPPNPPHPPTPPQPPPPLSGAFWSVDPVEWSPITSTPVNSVAPTASGYLQSKQAAPAPALPASFPVDVVSAISPRQGGDETSVEENHSTDEKTIGKLLNKMLPVVVVILLLLGLVGALLSSFYFPH